MVSYKYNISQTLNNIVNKDKLAIELSLLPYSVKKIYLYNNEIHVDVEEALTEIQVNELSAKIVEHDGAKATAFDRDDVEERELKIAKMIQQGLYHPYIDNDVMVGYLTSIDNYVNGYIRSGTTKTLIDKVILDTTTSSYINLLNQVVNTDGNKFYEIIIGTVTL